jgi:hypothetical protein
MKLYAFQPDTHGPPSYFVCAESMDDAIDAVDRHVAEGYSFDNTEWKRGRKGTRRQCYDMSPDVAVEPGVVVQNAND